MQIKPIIEIIQGLFSKRGTLMSFWQEVAENFYPERADFTLRREMGDEWASNLSTSYPIILRRDLGDQFGSMLRPTSKPWFHNTPIDIKNLDTESKQWLEWADGIQRRAMYDRSSQFTRATKEGDHDYAAFGQTVISNRLNKNGNGLLYKCWHLRDVVWMENEEGGNTLVARKWKPWAKDLIRYFGDKNHQIVKDLATKTPFEEVECYHIIIEADMYDDDAKGKPYFSIYYDLTHQTILEAVPVFNKEYIIPRWETVSGSQYAYSPATVVALPDARMLQSMSYTLLEAGEKATNPPMIAMSEVVRSDVSIYSGGITWIDHEYDERLGAALRPIPQDYSGLPIGVEMMRDSRTLLSHAFYLNKLNLPQSGPEMTAYEVGQRIQEYIRGALPIFEPMEQDYNGQLCELTFDNLMRAGAFGSMANMPKQLSNMEYQFRFESPLHDAIEAQHGQKFMEMRGLIAEAMTLDPTTAFLPDAKTALREALTGIGVPETWVNSESNVKEKVDSAEAAQPAGQQELETAGQGAEIAAKVSEASNNMSAA